MEILLPKTIDKISEFYILTMIFILVGKIKDPSSHPTEKKWKFDPPICINEDLTIDHNHLAFGRFDNE